MRAYEYKVVRDIPEIGARVWDVLVWHWPDVWLYRRYNDGRRERRKYSGHWTFLLLKYDSHLQPLDPANPKPLDLARLAAGDPQSLRPAPARPHLRLVK